MQFALCCCVRFCLESLTLQFTHVGGLIAISPYTCVIKTFANIHVNTCKYTCKYTEKHHGHGMSMFACVVGAKSASWRSGVCDAIRPHFKFAMSQFAHIAIRPMLLRVFFPSIRPYYKSPPFQIRPCFQLPPCGRANCN